MWALGVLVFKMMMGKEPFPYKNTIQISDAIKTNIRKPILSHYSPGLKKLVENLLNIDPHKRLTAD